MMGTITLFATFLFAFIAVYVENRWDTHCSKKIILPLIWYTIAVVKPIDHWLNPSLIQQVSQDYQEGSPTMRLILSVLMICSVLILITRRIDWAVLIKQNRFFLILLLFILASLIWSNYRFVAIKRYLRFIGDLLMVLIVLTEKEPIIAVKKIILNSAYLLVPLSIVLAKYYPNLGRAYNYSGTSSMWTGVTTHKNTLAIYCTISLITLIAVIFDNRVKINDKIQRFVRSLLFLMIVYILIGGGEAYPSATAIVTIPVGIIFFLLVRKTGNSRTGKEKATAVILSLIVLTIFGLQIILNVVVVGLLGRDLSFTGRDVIWRELIAIGKQHPILGSGFGSFWIQPILGVNQAHNGYLNIFLQLGILGLTLTGFYIIDAFGKLWQGHIDDAAYRLSLFSVVLVQNISEASLLQANSSVWIVFLLVSLTVQDTSNKYTNERDDHLSIRPDKEKTYNVNY